MLFVTKPKMRTYPLDQLPSRKQAVGLYGLTLPMDPARLYPIEPRTLLGKQTGDNAYALTSCLDPAIVSADPSTHLCADVPGRIVPHEHQNPLAKPLQLAAAP